ncbi:MAG TPA: HepT-like ribonuclease domain-containing protein [Chitinispirillaceae bacterium]|nr:HepT-like ribonuclease domain-containing protein [Chitinispirillaceae bacterium]
MFEADAIISKINIIRNCLKTIKKAGSELAGKVEGFLIDDVTVLNLERAIQACIDIAHIIIAQNNFSLPTTYKQSFEILAREKIIDNDMSAIMVKMVGFSKCCCSYISGDQCNYFTFDCNSSLVRF